MATKEQMQSKSDNRTIGKRKSPSPITDIMNQEESSPGFLIQRAKFDPRLMTPKDVLQLQRIGGNRATSLLLTGPASQSAFQAKLTVGAANDSYEQEADRVAAQVMSTPEHTPKIQRLGEEEEEIQAKPLADSITPLIQRTPAQEEDELQAKFIQRDAAQEEDELQAKSISNGQSFSPGADFEGRLSSTRGGGTPLPRPTRDFMESRFGTDFSGVRLHTGGESARLNREISAQAFTRGQDIYLGEGKENLESNAGKQLLAHELTHVVQQAGSTAQRSPQPQSVTNISRAHSDILQLARKGKRIGLGVGAASGALVGAAIGAALGSIFPGIGTLIGAGVGGGIGLLVGAIAGRKIGDKATGTEAEANRKELGEATTPTIVNEQAAWNNAASGNRRFVHGVTDYEIPHYAGRGTSQERIDQMTKKLTNPEVLQDLLVSTTLIDSVEGVVSDWTGSGLVLNIPKENIYAAASTDLSIDNDAIKKPGKLVSEITTRRDLAKSQSENRVETRAVTAQIEGRSPQEIAEIRSRKRGPLPTPDEIIHDTGRGLHNEIVTLGTAPTGQKITGGGYYYLLSYDGQPITSGALYTRPERIQLLKDLARLKNLPLYTIRSNVDATGRPANMIPHADVSRVGETIRIGPPFQ